MKSTVLSAAAAVTAAAFLLAAQPKRKITPEPLTIDVTVTDPAGNGVPDLGIDDFDVQLGGKPVRITKADFLAPRPSADGQPFLTIWPHAQPNGEDRRSVTVFLVDDLVLSTSARTSVREAIGQFIDQKIEPGDLVAVIRTRSGSGHLQELTADKATLHAAISAILPTASDAAPASMSYNDALAGLAVSVLRPLLDSLREVPGRKSVVLFSENMQLFGSPAVDVKALEPRANRASVIFYAVDPRGLVNASSSGLTLDQIPFSGGLGALARDTGGLFFDNTNDSARVLARISQTRTGYYRIGFSGELEPDIGRMLFGNVAVKVKRPGAALSTRVEYTRPPGAGYIEYPETPFGFQLPAAPLTSGGLRFRLTPLVSNATKHNVEVLLAIDGSEVALTSDAKGVDTAALEIGAIAVSGAGETVGRELRAYGLRLPSSRMQELRNGISATINLSVAASGPLAIEAVVRDATTGKVGAARELLQFPDLASGRLALSGLFLDGATAEAGKDLPGENAAIRVFHPGRNVRFSYAIFNAKLDADRKAHADLQTRVYRDGEAIYSNVQPNIPLGPYAEAGRWTHTGALQLGANARPGKYKLELTVTDRADTADPPPSATQTIDFEVR